MNERGGLPDLRQQRHTAKPPSLARPFAIATTLSVESKEKESEHLQVGMDC